MQPAGKPRAHREPRAQENTPSCTRQGNRPACAILDGNATESRGAGRTWNGMRNSTTGSTATWGRTARRSCSSCATRPPGAARVRSACASSTWAAARGRTWTRSPRSAPSPASTPRPRCWRRRAAAIPTPPSSRPMPAPCRSRAHSTWRSPTPCSTGCPTRWRSSRALRACSTTAACSWPRWAPTATSRASRRATPKPCASTAAITRDGSASQGRGHTAACWASPASRSS